MINKTLDISSMTVRIHHRYANTKLPIFASFTSLLLRKTIMQRLCRTQP